MYFLVLLAATHVVSKNSTPGDVDCLSKPHFSCHCSSGFQVVLIDSPLCGKYTSWAKACHECAPCQPGTFAKQPQNGGTMTCSKCSELETSDWAATECHAIPTTTTTTSFVSTSTSSQITSISQSAQTTASTTLSITAETSGDSSISTIASSVNSTQTESSSTKSCKPKPKSTKSCKPKRSQSSTLTSTVPLATTAHDSNSAVKISVSLSIVFILSSLLFVRN